MSVYDEIGIRRVLNASGSMTYLGGSLIAPDVVEKMGEAARSFIVMEELVEWACGEVARLTGTEAALVTTGTAGGILLATAAVLTGRDRQKMRSLPTVGPKCEILVQMPHRIGFDHAIGVAGGSRVEVGGPQGATREQLAAAIGPNTAAVFYVVLDPKPALSLADVAVVAHEKGVPVIVDAASIGAATVVKLLGLRYVLVMLVMAIPIIGQLLGLADALFIFRSDRRCVHDLLAGTKVVSNS